MNNDEKIKEYEAHKTPVPPYEVYKDLIDGRKLLREHIKDITNENAQLKEQINKYCLDAINRGTANAVKAVKEFGMPERIEELVKQNARLKERVSKLEKMQYSYTPEEWNTMLRTVNRTKELLKECKMPLEVYNEMFGNKTELLDKIDEVLK